MVYKHKISWFKNW